MSASEMTAEQVLAWKAGWAEVNRREIEELRAKTMERKLEELEMLYGAALEFGWKRPATDTEIARSRWLKLRRAHDR